MKVKRFRYRDLLAQLNVASHEELDQDVQVGLKDSVILGRSFGPCLDSQDNPKTTLIVETRR